MSLRSATASFVLGLSLFAVAACGASKGGSSSFQDNASPLKNGTSSNGLPGSCGDPSMWNDAGETWTWDASGVGALHADDGDVVTLHRSPGGLALVGCGDELGMTLKLDFAAGVATRTQLVAACDVPDASQGLGAEADGGVTGSTSVVATANITPEQRSEIQALVADLVPHVAPSCGEDAPSFHITIEHANGGAQSFDDMWGPACGSDPIVDSDALQAVLTEATQKLF